MADERHCGDKLCMVAGLKEDINGLTASHGRLIELLSEQKSISTHVSNLQYEFNRYRDEKAEEIKEASDRVTRIEGRINLQLDNMVTKKDLTLYLAILGGIISLLSFIFNYIFQGMK